MPTIILHSMSIASQDVVVTLYEGHYEKGVGSLINSLSLSGFKGLIIVGYRDTIPSWVGQLQQEHSNSYIISKEIKVHFEHIITAFHFGYYKPYFILSTLNKYKVENIYYFDPDIVVIAEWSFFNKWVKAGIAICVDNCFPFVHSNHPWRREWRQLANVDIISLNKVDYYFNSGFIGLSHNQTKIIDRWIELTEKYIEHNGNVTKFEKSPERAFKGDQDILNAAITVTPDINYSIIGKEGMGFSHPAFLMLHAVENIKPWKINFIISALKGVSPTLAAKGYWKYTKKPIKLYNSLYLHKKMIAILISSFIGRFYSKNI